MNPTIENMLKHVSVRKFTDQPITDQQKDNLLKAAQSGSTTELVQAFSIIEITDPQLRSKISDITESSHHVETADTFYIFVADLNRQYNILKAKNLPVDSLQNMESLLVATIDTTIAAQNMAIAAESMGLGICYIGSIRNNIKEVAHLLNLPKYTFPVFGMTVGVPSVKNPQKPRLLRHNQVATNTYDSQNFDQLSDYDQIIKEYYAHRNTNQQDTTWTEKNLSIFKQANRPEVTDFLKKQGFALK